jgi:hypothetical protein
VERRIHRAFLPAWEVTHLITNDVVIAARGLQQLEPLTAQRDGPRRRAAAQPSMLFMRAQGMLTPYST